MQKEVIFPVRAVATHFFLMKKALGRSRDRPRTIEATENRLSCHNNKPILHCI